MAFEDIKLQAVPMGRDLAILITGGAAHIGATSTAYWSGEKIEVSTSAVPGHKEHVLTAGMARQAAQELRRTVTVIMGIHYDDLSKAEIVEVSARTDAIFRDYLSTCSEYEGKPMEGE